MDEDYIYTPPSNKLALLKNARFHLLILIYYFILIKKEQEHQQQQQQPCCFAGWLQRHREQAVKGSPVLKQFTIKNRQNRRLQ